jgi:hypothetical protein
MRPLSRLLVAGLFCFTLSSMLVGVGWPASGIFQAAASETPTATPGPPTETPVTPTALPSVTPTGAIVTPTPPPATLRPTITPEPLPPPEEIGSTNGIITWGVIMVAIILAVLLWHRPDWAGKSARRG